jgi:hypothetical protein
MCHLVSIGCSELQPVLSEGGRKHEPHIAILLAAILLARSRSSPSD